MPKTILSTQKGQQLNSLTSADCRYSLGIKPISCKLNEINKSKYLEKINRIHQPHNAVDYKHQLMRTYGCLGSDVTARLTTYWIFNLIYTLKNNS